VPRTGAAERAAEKEPEATVSVTTGTFITKESLLSFAGASFAVAVGSKVVRSLGYQREDIWPELVFGILIALLIAWISTTDPRLELTTREKRIAYAVALLNGMYLALAAVGATSVATGGEPKPPPTTTAPASPAPPPSRPS
jgi:branched-subunit amino acid permease